MPDKLTFARLAIYADLIATFTVTGRPRVSDRTVVLATQERAVGGKLWRNTEGGEGGGGG